MNAYTPEQRRADTLTPVVGDAFQARATHQRRSLLRVSALCVGIAIAGCSRPDATPSAQGGYVKLFTNEWAEVDKLCDNGRLVYFASTGQANGGAALAVVPDAKECAGSAYVVEERK